LHSKILPRTSSRTPAGVPVLGLTGAVGAGKSTAARALSLLGCVVIDVDRLGHEALDAPAVREAVAREFGTAVLGADGRVDRRALGAAVFDGDADVEHGIGAPRPASDDAIRRLESLVHPWVLRRLRRDLAAAKRARPRAVVLDCALLLESGLDDRCDATIVVEAAEQRRVRRVAASRGWSAREFKRRQAAQWPAPEKRSRADRILRNDGTPGELQRACADLLDELAPVAPVSRGGTAGTRRRPAAAAASRPARRAGS